MNRKIKWIGAVLVGGACVALGDVYTHVFDTVTNSIPSTEGQLFIRQKVEN